MPKVKTHNLKKVKKRQVDSTAPATVRKVKKTRIGIVIPTIRPDQYKKFLSSWMPLLNKHEVSLIIVWDGDKPKVENEGSFFSVEDILGLDKDLLSNHCAGVRNLGFAFIARYHPEIEYIITLDDDEEPIGDPIQDHIDALHKRVPISWFSTAGENYMRGFPYGVRTEAPVMISHGVWENNYDWDAPSQLIKGDSRVEFYKGPVPKGALFPMCGMNLAFRREALPYMYFAPVGQYKGAERFDDIWMGIEAKKDMDKLNWAVVTGYAVCNHTRASNVFSNLKKEAVGIQKNEDYWQGKYDDWYKKFLEKRKRWYSLITHEKTT